MSFTSRFRALLGVAIAPLLAAVLIMAGATGLSSRSTAAAGDCTADPALDSVELQFLTLINNHRAQNGLGPLAPSYTLSKAAQWKSNDLGVNAYFAHDDLTRTWVQRLRDCGHTANAWLGENIAGGTESAQAAFDIFKNSPGHNANMLGTAYTGIGIGRAYVAGSPFGWYWTTEFTSINDPFSGGATPTATRTATRTPTRTPTRTATAAAPTATSTPAAPSPTAAPRVAMRVTDLDGYSWGSTWWYPRVTIRLKNSSNQNVGGAIVNGRWSDGTIKTCITGNSGACTLQGPNQPASTASVSFTINYISKSGMNYDGSANSDADGDSTGTSITIVN